MEETNQTKLEELIVIFTILIYSLFTYLIVFGFFEAMYALRDMTK
jgi:hypothetical protein